jgi:hypothetical protein
LQVVERLFSEERARSYDDAIFVGIDEVAGRKGKASKGNRNVAVNNSRLNQWSESPLESWVTIQWLRVRGTLRRGECRESAG